MEMRLIHTVVPRIKGNLLQADQSEHRTESLNKALNVSYCSN